MGMTLRILLVDDHQIFREALRSLLEKVPGYDVVGETGDGSEVVACARDHAPDLVCMDIGMPGMDGIHATRELKAAFPKMRVIALSAFADHRNVTDILAAGASAYVSKAEATDELLRAISAVQRDGLYLSPVVSNAIAQSLAQEQSSSIPPPSLGTREREVLRLVARGLTSVEIAKELHITPYTVEAHRRNIMRKLDLHSVAALTQHAIRTGLI
jgi:two-component system NarL family response regulator